MSTLQEILGDRYDEVLHQAMAAPRLHARNEFTMRDRVADTLAAVLPDLLAKATLEGFERAKVETEAAIKPVIRAAMHHAWQEGVATTLDHAIRNPDGITLRLEHLDGRPWASPYAPEEGS